MAGVDFEAPHDSYLASGSVRAAPPSPAHHLQAAQQQPPHDAAGADDGLPDSWVRYLYQNEPRLFVLSGLCKVAWSTGIIGITVLLLNMGDYATGSNGKPLDPGYALTLCFIYIPIMIAFSLSNLGKEYLCAQMASKIKARLAARIAQHCVLNASTDASERAFALSLASSDTNQVAPPSLPHCLATHPHAAGVRRCPQHPPAMGLAPRSHSHHLRVPVCRRRRTRHVLTFALPLAPTSCPTAFL